LKQGTKLETVFVVAAIFVPLFFVVLFFVSFRLPLIFLFCLVMSLFSTHIFLRLFFFFCSSLCKSYTEWAYWPSSSPPSPSESLRCSLGAPLTSGPFVLPDGASICFVFERCDGPFLGGMRVAVSPDGTELELSAPFAGFLRDAATGQDAVRVGQTVTVQFSLETSGQVRKQRDFFLFCIPYSSLLCSCPCRTTGAPTPRCPGSITSTRRR
jgi:hypothetical protein